MLLALPLPGPGTDQARRYWGITRVYRITVTYLDRAPVTVETADNIRSVQREAAELAGRAGGSQTVTIEAFHPVFTDHDTGDGRGVTDLDRLDPVGTVHAPTGWRWDYADGELAYLIGGAVG